MLRLVRLSNRQKNALETGTPEMIVGREIGATEERTTIRSQKRCERPTTLSADGRDGGLIAAIDVGTFITIDLHRNELVVDDSGDLGIVVRLAIHHVAPVT